MEQVAPCGPVYQAGTLSGNPVAMAAGLAQLTYLRDHPEVYTDIGEKGKWLAEAMRAAAKRHNVPVTVNQVESLLSPFFTAQAVEDLPGVQTSDLSRYAAYFAGMLQRGVALAPAQFEAMFVSAAHTREQLEATAQAADEVFASL